MSRLTATVVCFFFVFFFWGGGGGKQCKYSSGNAMSRLTATVVCLFFFGGGGGGGKGTFVLMGDFTGDRTGCWINGDSRNDVCLMRIIIIIHVCSLLIAPTTFCAVNAMLYH